MSPDIEQAIELADSSCDATTCPELKIRTGETMKHFPLARQSGRVALLLGVLAQAVTAQEIQAAVLLDTEKRPRVKPVVAGGRRYSSVIAAADGLARRKHPLWTSIVGQYGSVSLGRLAVARAISYRATKDTFHGFYWI